ncbi:hypothetical protein EIP91_002114 [Steccherinum ochraceum]|uniref:Uncharacterized protein n=1 Tax=Steccherinum ochraceum TaxID=92696 RepID=A0A4R0S0W9_9APHY|nr:hypothetical protein EIP91_002114 [Steccherinum ochraceum]
MQSNSPLPTLNIFDHIDDNDNDNRYGNDGQSGRRRPPFKAYCSGMSVQASGTSMTRTQRPFTDLPRVDPTEVWDDDFEFNQNNEDSGHRNTRRSTTSTQNNEDWDDEPRTSTSNSTPLKDRKNVPKADTSLLHWAEPGPSTPSRKPTAHTENWDDDFQDRTDSPLYPHGSDVSPRSRKSRRRVHVPETENWDDEFEAGGPNPHSPFGKSTRWDSSSSSDEDFGSGSKEDDRTVTSRSRRATLPMHAPGGTPPPPVPSIPATLLGISDPSPFPRSPTASVFSVPVSSAGGRESIAYSYSSTAHLALRPTTSGSSFSALPPSPPIHRERERRRLRKKSRPPRLDDNIYELDDRAGADIPTTRPSLSEAESPADVSVSLPEPPAVDPNMPLTNKPTGLVSRIGSVGKKWGASRKKRASTGPGELSQHMAPETPRGPAASSSPPSATTSRTGWFFRHGGAGAGSGSPPAHQTALPLKHEKSVDRLLSMVGVDPDSPSRRRRAKEKEGELGASASEDGHVTRNGSPQPGPSLLFGTPRRPTSMAIPNHPKSSSRCRGSRHASYGQTPRTASSSRSSSKQRSASASVEEFEKNQHSQRGDKSIVIQEHPLPVRREGGEAEKAPTEGHRSFMGGMRRISLGSKHKRNQSTVPEPQTKSKPRRSRSRERPSTSTAATAVSMVPDRSDDATPRPPSRLTRPSGDSLLPPIELQPPSPPRPARAPHSLATSVSEPAPSIPGIESLLNPIPLKASSSGDTSTSSDGGQPVSPTIRARPPASPQQSASLGRSAIPPKDPVTGIVPRRNSLGDLKIPARISQAQVGLKRDLTMVRDFAASVEQLKELQAMYSSLIAEVQALLLSTAPPDPPPQSRAISPTLFNLPRPGSRARSNTNPQASLSTQSLNQASNHRQMTTAFRNIMSKYHISWECAELLIELGGGPPASEGTSSPPPGQAPGDQPCASSVGSNAVPVPPPQSRERAVTLAGDEPKPHIPAPGPVSPPIASPPHTSQWRASTGRHDLSQRQLLLLREMLNNGPDGGGTSYMGLDYHIPEEEVNKAWRWGDAMSSTVTLPSEDSSHPDPGEGGRISPKKKRRSSRLGMRGLRDMLKSLKRSYTEQSSQSAQSSRPPPLPLPLPVPPSTTSIPASTDSSLNLPSESQAKLPRPQSMIQRRRAKTSTGPESMKSLRENHHPNSPYGTAPPHKSSPRRPSLASIFRLSQKHKTQASAPGASPSSANSGRELSVEDVLHTGSSSSGHITGGTNTPEEEDWDRVDSASDLDLASRAFGINVTDGTATVRGKKGRSPYLQQPQDKAASGVFPETPKRTPNPSQSSIFAGSSESPQKSAHPPLPSHSPSASVSAQTAHYYRSAKLSNVRELKESDTDAATPHKPERQSRRISGSSSKGKQAPSPSPNRKGDRPVSRASRRGLQGSMRSTPPQTWMSQGHGYSPELQASGLPFNAPPPPPVPLDAPSGLALSMTPENIKPLLENAREVHTKCHECIEELKGLLAARQLVE